MNMYKTMVCFTGFMAWMNKALADGKLSIKEIVELGEQTAETLGIPVEYDIPGFEPQTETGKEV